jgi:proline dehydrogenase
MARKPPPPSLEQVLLAIIDAAAAQNTRVWIDAEQTTIQPGIDSWTIDLMRRYNRNGRNRVYTTFQAYLKSTPSRIAQHLELAAKENWILGIKLVRGAYIASEPRQLIHDTKEETDKAYNFVVENLLSKTFPGIKPEEMPQVSLMLASHNEESAMRGYELWRSRILSGKPTIDVEFAQLQGMSDELSCRLVQLGRVKGGEQGSSAADPVPRAYKYLLWGTTQECMLYLMRRAVENKGAIERTRYWRTGLGKELWRRCRHQFKGFRT